MKKALLQLLSNWEITSVCENGTHKIFKQPNYDEWHENLACGKVMLLNLFLKRTGNESLKVQLSLSMHTINKDCDHFLVYQYHINSFQQNHNLILEIPQLADG